MQCRTLFSSQIAVNLSRMRKGNYGNDNYDPNSEQINEFQDSAKRTEEFMHTLLCPHGLENQYSF